MRISADKLNISLDLAKIEVTAIVKPSESDSDGSYLKTFRFTTSDGEVLEVFCSAGDEAYLQTQEVAELPVLKKKPRPLNWLHPKKR
jgi:hypothetical protein